MYKWRLWNIPAQQVVSTLVGIHTSQVTNFLSYGNKNQECDLTIIMLQIRGKHYTILHKVLYKL